MRKISPLFLRAYRALPRYQDRGWPFSAFLYQIARRLLVDHFRGRRPEVAWSEAHDQVDYANALEQGVERTQDWEAVSAAMSTLPDEHQEVIRLRVILGLSTPGSRLSAARRSRVPHRAAVLRRSVPGDDGWRPRGTGCSTRRSDRIQAGNTPGRTSVRRTALADLRWG
jgi:hypothetical protein